jgi:hypothetical protein
MKWPIFDRRIHVNLTRRLNAATKESGQVLVMFALLIPLFLLFTGFAVDFGFGFLAKAELAKGCDAANLETMLNLGQGSSAATAIGQSVFASNYVGDPLFKTLPTASIAIGADANGNPICNCTANAIIPTHFIKLMGLSTLNIGDNSQATRPPVILSMVLDRTGSMKSDGGSTALPGAVNDFSAYFIEGTDQLGEVSFAWSATDDVPIGTTFKAPINTSLNAMNFADGTYSMDGLQHGFNQVTGVASPPVNSVKVVVFFTDGWNNTIQAYLPSPTAANKVMVEFGGDAATSGGVNEGNSLVFLDPKNFGWNSGNGFYGSSSASPTTTVTCQNGNGTRTYPTDNNDNLANCNGANTFVPIGGSNDPLGTSAVPLNRINITQDAEYSTYQLAEQMRAQGITVYSIGLGSDIDQSYLQEIANDPAGSQYKSSEPAGLAVFAPTGADLNAAFQTVASKILLRLTQ